MLETFTPINSFDPGNSPKKSMCHYPLLTGGETETQRVSLTLRNLK